MLRKTGALLPLLYTSFLAQMLTVLFTYREHTSQSGCTDVLHEKCTTNQNVNRFKTLAGRMNYFANFD
jgi:hypothetical protein